ncbi:hypothetical protein SAV14893_080210 [Streptomyces avermitilis]|uniref:Tail specific protease domain-containing protein n=1 Tax=Streptomyces avermitilis TaxID=33903 RepID=A0A4D4M9U2_STRAX|nr:hypothetical protein SAV14893_080210 [Streptomyces avermitilis]
MTDEANRPIPDFVPNAAEPVREHLAASTDLATFLRQAGTLTLDERRLIAAQALILLEQNYVHLPLKAAMYAVNPVQRLRLLIHRLERQTPQDMPPEWMFHTEMSEIFHSVRDLHTNYLLPEPFVGKIAFLPFLVERYTDQQGAHFMVTQVAEGFLAPGFKPGVEITHWSGIPIAEAVDLAAARFAGSNPEARRSRGVQSLTVRPLRIHLPPFEEWVTISYVDEGGTKREFRENWRVVDNLPAFVDADTVSSVAAAQGLDLEADETSRARVLLFAPRVLAQAKAAEAGEPAPDLRAGEIATTLPNVFRARTVQTSAGTFGHLRIFTFSVDNLETYMKELLRLIGLLPDRGLILDVRDNGGASSSPRSLPCSSSPPAGSPRSRCSSSTHRSTCGSAASTGTIHGSTSVRGCPRWTRPSRSGPCSPAPSRSARRTPPTRSVSSTSGRSCSSPTRAATPPPTSSPPASRTTTSARFWAPISARARAAPMYGRWTCSPTSWRAMRTHRTCGCRRRPVCAWRSAGPCACATTPAPPSRTSESRPTSSTG